MVEVKKQSKKVSKLANFGNKIHKLTKAEKSKGGKTMTDFRKFRLSITPKTKCVFGAKCGIHPCRYALLSKEKFNGKCALAQQSDSTIRRYHNIISGKEDLLFKEAEHALMGVKNDAQFIKSCAIIHKIKYGEKIKQEINMEKPVIVKIQEAFQEYEKELKKKKKELKKKK